MRAPESNLYTSATATNSGAFLLTGGNYHAAVIQTGSGTVELQRLGPDGTTWLPIMGQFNNAGAEADLKLLLWTAAAQNAAKRAYLGPGSYRWAVATSTNIFAEIVRIPAE